jgi:peptidoglycan/LPS O-acetylase OafA/YrhL
MKYIKGLDALRALAVAFVVIEHWGPFFRNHRGLRYLKDVFIPDGQFGVNLFYVLSGFLITSLLLKARFDPDSRPIKVVKNFFIRRALRIFPIYYLMILVLVLIHYPFVREHIWYFLTYTGNIPSYLADGPNPLSHTWSLAVEEQFYIVWPWLIVFVPKQWLKFVFIAAIALGIGSTYYVMHFLHHTYPLLMWNCLDPFGIGGLLAYYTFILPEVNQVSDRELAAYPLKSAHLPALNVLITAIFWLGVALVIGNRALFYAGFNLQIGFLIKTIDSMVALGLIWFVIHAKPGWIKKHVLEHRWLNYLGAISYGLYLYHYPLQPIYARVMVKAQSIWPQWSGLWRNFYFVYASRLLLLLVIAALSFRYIEQPIRSLKKKFRY